MVARLNRRQFLQLGLLGGVSLLGGGLLDACVRRADGPTDSHFDPDLEIRLRATQAKVALLPGDLTTVWMYQATISKGHQASVQSLPHSYLGPIIRVSKGQKIRVHFANDLPEAKQRSIVHWHGLHLAAEMDAHPRYAIDPGQTYVYEFTVQDRAGTYWFHPHPDMLTGKQVYMGLAGLFIVTDDEESKAGLPSGAQDVPLIIQDRTFDAANRLVYLADGDAMASMMGFLGQRILVNGRPDFALEASTRVYRLRLLNGSNARIYKLAWSDGTPLTVIGSDGGLLQKPVQRGYVMLSPGERVELWADLSKRRLGEELTLQSLTFQGAEDSDTGLLADAAPPLGAAMTVLRIRIVRQEPETLRLPTRLSSIVPYKLMDAVNRDNPRQFTLSHWRTQWLINGLVFGMDEATEGETVKLNATEVWEIINKTNPGEAVDPNGMVHPFHVHGLQFSIIERQVLPELKAGWDTVREGYVDEGWKDTMMLMPGERARLLMRFSDFTGLYLYHCHNLEHEDAGMMRNYLVKA